MRKLITLKEVGIRYSKRAGLFKQQYIWPLKDVSFDLYAGETLGIIGKNGAGKSTLLKLLAGIIGPDKGVLYRESISVSLLSLQVGFKHYLSGRENAIINGILLGMTEREVIAAMDDIVTFAGLEDHIDDAVKTYSTGMRARLGFAVASHTRPDVMLIDEALGVGDREFRKKSREHILERMRSDQTVVMVSHDEETILSHCSRALLLEDGIIKVVGDPDVVIETYHQTSEIDKLG